MKLPSPKSSIYVCPIILCAFLCHSLIYGAGSVPSAAGSINPLVLTCSCSEMSILGGRKRVTSRLSIPRKSPGAPGRTGKPKGPPKVEPWCGVKDALGSCPWDGDGGEAPLGVFEGV